MVQKGQPAGQESAVKPQDTKTSNYWRENLKLLGILLTIWFVVSFGAGIIFVDVLNKLSFYGVPLGFWFAQQGSILIFVGLIFVYTHQMKKLDQRFGVKEE